MDATVEMKRVRDYLRNQVKMINKDPFLAKAANRISARIVKWNKREHSALICIRDVEAEYTKWNTADCCWLWVYTWHSANGYDHWKWEIWQELNNLVIKILHSETI